MNRNNKKEDDREMRVWLYFQEKLINHTDINNRMISNERARIVLGVYMRLKDPIRTSVLTILENHNLIRRVDKKHIEILHPKTF